MRNRLIFPIIALSLATGLSAGTALADSLALLVTNTAYGDARVGSGPAQNHALLANAYRAQGFEVIEGRDMSAGELRSLIESFYDRLEDKDRLVIHFTGRAASFGEHSWILPVDTATDSLVDVDYEAPSVSMLLDILALAPGHSALFFADTGSNLRHPFSDGIRDVPIPQGVLLISGPEKPMNDFVMDELLVAEKPVAQALLRADNALQIAGFASPDISLAPTDAPTPPSPLDDLTADQSLWAAAHRSGRAEDYREYLRRFPHGIFAASAQARLDALETPAAPSAEETEDALHLTRADRRDIQGNLTVLGYNTRGVDGIFGRGTRGAISAWQKDEDVEQSGYLTAWQIADISGQASIRRAAIEREDNRYWNATGLSGRKADLQLYLSKYPNGQHAAEAKEALAEIAADEQEQADTAAWTRAVSENTADSYREYLAGFPDGIYAAIAKDRIAALDPGSLLPDAEEAAKDAEARLGLNPATRLLIESRLRGLGFNPGMVDGAFTATTRAAIKAYQNSKGLDATGYINSETVRALLIG